VKPQIDIVIGETSAASSVAINGVDVTSAIRSISVSIQAGGSPLVLLGLAGPHVSAKVSGAIETIIDSRGGQP
jgi:hypothetical protein